MYVKAVFKSRILKWEQREYEEEMKSNKTLAYYNTNTITFLREADRDKLSTIGHVFGNEKLQKKDSFIKECYKKHSRIYDGVTIDVRNSDEICK